MPDSQAIESERRSRSSRIRRSAYLFSGITCVVVVVVVSFMMMGPIARSKWEVALVCGGLVVVPVLLLTVGLAVPGSLLRRYVSRLRVGEAVMLLSATAELVVALRELAPNFNPRIAAAVAVGPDGLRIWSRRTPAPDVMIPYPDIRRIWIDQSLFEIGTGARARVSAWGTVVLEVEVGGGAALRVPLVPSPRKFTWDRGAGVVQFVEALNARTALPWLDAPPEEHPAPDTTAAPEAEAPEAAG